jgi:hypothetical protein
MKCVELKSVFDRLQPLYAEAHAEAPQALLQLSELLAAANSMTVAQCAKVISKLDNSALDSGSRGVSKVCQLLKAVGGFLEDAGKPAIKKDIVALEAALRPHASSSIEDLIAAFKAAGKPRKAPKASPARAEVVQVHLRALEQSLGDETGFASAFHALQADPDVRAPELVAVAKQFAFANVKSGPAALERIWARHQALMISRAKAAATAGRVAG